MVRVSGSGKELKRICWLIVAGLLGACTPAPEFTDATGKSVSLRHFAGKPLLINYFAPWCAPCLREMPRLNALAAGGKIIISRSTREAAGEAVEVTALPPAKVKGKTEPIEVFEVTGLRETQAGAA